MYERILLPTDGSDLANQAFEHALDLAETYDAELHFVYAVDVPTEVGDIDASMVRRELENVGEEASESLAHRAEEAGLDVTTELLRGRPHEAILNYADENDVDLIVMATHGRSGLDRYLLGSVTEKVVRLSDVPVLTVRAGEDSESE